MRVLLEAEAFGDALAGGDHRRVVLAVDHAVKVVGPMLGIGAAAVAKRHPGFMGQRFAEAVDVGGRHGPDAHRVGLVAEFVMADDHAETLDVAGVQPAFDALDQARFIDTELCAERGVGAADQGQSTLQGLKARGIRRIDGGRGVERAQAWAGFLAPGQIKTEIDVIRRFQRQRDQRAAALLAHLRQRRFQ